MNCTACTKCTGSHNGFGLMFNITGAKSNNTYKDIIVNNYDDAIKLIKDDLNKQQWKCGHEIETFK